MQNLEIIQEKAKLMGEGKAVFSIRDIRALAREISADGKGCDYLDFASALTGLPRTEFMSTGDTVNHTKQGGSG